MILKWAIYQQQLLIIHFDNTCHKSISKGKVACQAVCNKLEAEVAPKALQDLGRLEKALISRSILFKKIAITHGKGEFFKKNKGKHQ